MPSLSGDVTGPHSETKVASVGGATAAEIAAVVDEAPLSAPLPATTTAQEDLNTAGQRRVNILWERTQAIIAIVVVFCTMGATTYGYLVGIKGEMPSLLAVAFGTVVGFYFSRTNHQAIGGVGRKPSQQEYIGR